MRSIVFELGGDSYNPKTAIDHPNPYYGAKVECIIADNKNCRFQPLNRTGRDLLDDWLESEDMPTTYYEFMQWLNADEDGYITIIDDEIH